MRGSKSIGRWGRLGGQAALVLGLGALAAAGGRADAGPDQRDAGVAPSVQGKPEGPREMRIRIDGARIFLSEGGGDFRELALGDEVHAQRLKALLAQNAGATGPKGIRLDQMLLAGAGGEGFHWSRGGKTATGGKAGPRKSSGEQG